MVYRAIGVMSGSSLDGLDLACVTFEEQGGKWSYDIQHAACFIYEKTWSDRLKSATGLPARDYMQLHNDFGHFIGQKINEFIDANGLHFQVSLIASHGHTTFHDPPNKLTAQLGNGAAIAAETKLPVISDLRSMDIALGGQGAPIVPIGEQFLFPDYDWFLNIGGIANISKKNGSNGFIAFDVCPANRVLNMLALEKGEPFDNGGAMAASGSINQRLLEQLNGLDYYDQPFPKSLGNDFGTETIYPIIKDYGIHVNDALRTYTEHIVFQITKALRSLNRDIDPSDLPSTRMLSTGGGSFNTFLVRRLKESLQELNIEVIVPEPNLVSYKEALIMAFIGVLRWRQEVNVLASVTGALRDSVGGALWIS